jgi:copper transport protein
MATVRLIPLLATALSLYVCAAGPAIRPAAAHAVLIGTTPGSAQVVERVPAAVTLRFNEAVRPIVVLVLDHEGREVAVQAATVDRDLRLTPRQELKPGGYVVSYRVTSGDSHPVGGAFQFAVGAWPPAWRPGRAIDPAMETVWGALAAANRFLHYAALLAAAGGALFCALVAGLDSPAARRSRRPLVVFAGVGVATAAVGVGLQGALLAAAPAAAFLSTEPWRIGAGTAHGISALVAVLGLAFLAALFARAERPPRLAVLAGAVAALASAPLTGHAASAPPRWLATGAVFVHVVAGAYWLGSLLPLHVALRELPSGEAAAVTRRFSRGAAAGVGLLVAAGAAIAWAQLRALSPLATTDYGRVLAGKWLLVVALLALAAYNKGRLTPELAAGWPTAAGRLRLSIAAEGALMAVVLALTALLGQLPPPRIAAFGDLSQGARMGDHLHAVSVVDKHRADVMLTPGAAGWNMLTVFVVDAKGDVVDLPELKARIANPDRGIEPLTARLLRVEPGYYRGDGPEFSLSGSWTVSVEAPIGDFDKAVFEASFVLP